MAFIKAFIFFILFIPMLTLVVISHYLHPYMENIIEKSRDNYWYIFIVLLLTPIFLPATLILSHGYNLWDDLGG